MEGIEAENLKLVDKIVELQSRMIHIGTSKGLGHPETIKCSQELDVVLNSFRKIYWESPNDYRELLKIIHK